MNFFLIIFKLVNSLNNLKGYKYHAVTLPKLESINNKEVMESYF